MVLILFWGQGKSGEAMAKLLPFQSLLRVDMVLILFLGQGKSWWFFL